ncbi:MAG: hypothetical protein JOZ60_02245 [Verrucomicrobia bacterium]|nr:hypothetical protein [Verrucomicrobiota bacterium]
MSFDDYRRAIEISSDPQLVEEWKEEARKSVTYRTKDQENPVALDSLAAVEQHFRANYLPSLVRRCLAAELSGETARHLPDRGIVAAIRKARDRENRFPAQIAGALRHGLNQAGLHVFKHKRRILYISTVRPQLFDTSQGSVSVGVSAVLSTIKSYPKISRKQLAEKALAKLIGEKSKEESSEEYQHAKTTLATDLIWLAKAGHVIEFADGSLDLPLPPRPVETAKGGAAPATQQNLETEETDNSPEAESSSGQSESEELTGESSVVEPASGEATLEPSLQLPTDPPELLEPGPESLEQAPSHSDLLPT